MIYFGIPVHDERHTVGVLMWRIRKLMREEHLDFRILVVDDASTDGTSEVLEPYRRVLPLRVIRHDERRGYAACLERIVRAVLEDSDYHRRDALVCLQGDFTHAPEAIPEFLRRFQSGTDLVLGVPRGGRNRPRAVRMGRAGAAVLERSLPVPAGASAPTCGFRLYRLFLLQRALTRREDPSAPLLRHRGWAANAELLLHVWPHARRVEEVEFPEDYTRRYRESRFRPFRQLWNLFRAGRDPALRGLLREAAEAPGRSGGGEPGEPGSGAGEGKPAGGGRGEKRAS